MALSSLERAIILTVSYTDQFSYPLTEVEVWQRLLNRVGWWWVVLTKTPSKKAFALALKSLIRKNILESDGTFYWLRGRSFLVDRRQRHLRSSAAKWQEVEEFIQFVRKVPWITAVFITGSLAMNNADLDDDSDFMIITRPGRLWLARLVVSLFAKLKGKRRSWQGEEKRSWCFNLWIEENALDILAEEHSLYKAYELVQATCIYDTHKVVSRLHTITAWVLEYLPNAQWKVRKTLPQIEVHRTWLGRLNRIAFEFQMWYMVGHMTRERVSEQYAFFHPRDTQGGIIENWITSLNEYAKEAKHHQ